MAGELILVVDDTHENREFLVNYVLEPQGYRSLVARDGREGLEMAIEHKPDLILLDLQMPRMDGLGVLRNLRAHELDIPVILMTFHGSEEIAVEVYRQGVRDYVKKPFTVQEMQAAIDRSLGEVRLRRDKEALTERLIQSNRELQRRVQELNVLYSVGKSVTGILDLNELMPRIVDAAIQVTHAEEGELFLLNEGDQLMRRAFRRNGARQALPVSEPAANPLAVQVVATGEPVTRTPTAPSDQPSAVYAPLTFGGRVIGVLGVINRTPGARAFTRHDSALFLDFLKPPRHFGHAPCSFAGAGFPVGLVAALRSESFPRHGQRLIMRCQFGSGGLQCLPGRFVARLRGFKFGAPAIG